MNRSSRERTNAAIVIVTSLAAALIAFDLLVFAFGESPREIGAMLLRGTWGSAGGFGQVVFKATPLLFTGVAVDVALRAGLFNIGAEGQVAVASLAVGVVGAWLPPSIAAPIAVPFLFVVALVAGAFWAVIPAVLKARFGAHEVISTIMMNRIAEAVVGLALGLGIAQTGTTRTHDIVAGARLARLDRVPGFGAFRGSAASVAIFVAIGIAIVIVWSHTRTRFGRELGLIGKNTIACAAARIPVRRRIAEALIVSGAIAGLASLGTVLGYKGYFEQGLGAGVGFAGLAVALLGRSNVLGLVFAALLFGTLDQGGLAINERVPKEVMELVEGVVICVVALSDARVRAAAARGIAIVTRSKSAEGSAA